MNDTRGTECLKDAARKAEGAWAVFATTTIVEFYDRVAGIG